MADEPDRAETTSGPQPRRRPPKFIVAVGSALILAIATAIGTGLGSRFLDLFKQERKPISYSAAEQIVQCGTELFVPGERARSLVTGATHTDPDWSAFRRSNQAVVAGQDVVQVSIQGESSRTITLTGITFSVERRPRPGGAIFANPCGGGLTGRSVVADLDRTPAAVVKSVRDPGGTLGAIEAGQRVEPIRFPWTVSLTDPLLLYVVATTRRCACVWRAEIPWRSGERSGRIRIDNAGKGYEIAGEDGVTKYLNGGSGPSSWRLFKGPGGTATLGSPGD